MKGGSPHMPTSRFPRFVFNLGASVFVLVLANVFSAAALAQGQRAMTLVDFLNVPRVSDPQLSPDGSQILFVRAEANWNANKPIGHIWRINADGTGQVQMTNGGEGESSPRCSTDAKR